jgi:hypothetical protein
MPQRERVGRNGAAEKLRAAEDQQTHAWIRSCR